MRHAGRPGRDSKMRLYYYLSVPNSVHVVMHKVSKIVFKEGRAYRVLLSEPSVKAAKVSELRKVRMPGGWQSIVESLPQVFRVAPSANYKELVSLLSRYTAEELTKTAWEETAKQMAQAIETYKKKTTRDERTRQEPTGA